MKNFFPTSLAHGLYVSAGDRLQKRVQRQTPTGQITLIFLHISMYLENRWAKHETGWPYLAHRPPYKVIAQVLTLEFKSQLVGPCDQTSHYEQMKY